MKNDDDVSTMLTCNEQYSCVGPIELLCSINKTFDGILNLLQSTITHIHDAICCITMASERYQDKVIFWVTPSLIQTQ